jgi:hypothetical protein
MFRAQFVLAQPRSKPDARHERFKPRTSCMSYSPGARPITQRAATNAPCVNMLRSSTTCESVTTSSAAANVTLCSPTMPPPRKTEKHQDRAICDEGTSTLTRAAEERLTRLNEGGETRAANASVTAAIKRRATRPSRANPNDRNRDRETQPECAENRRNEFGQ